MNIAKNIQILGLALYFGNNLVIADTHIGYEEALNKQGILIPRFQFNEIIRQLEKILSTLKKKPDRIIINGDIKHEFGKISEQEWRQTSQLIGFLSKHCNEIILVKGNHDKLLGPIAEKKNIKIVESLIAGDKLIIHGNRIPQKIDSRIKTIIIAHEHPAISIKDGSRKEVFKCFLKGSWKGRGLIVQPSLNPVAEGTDLLREKPISPFLKHDLSRFEVFAVADKVYDFGRIKDIGDVKG